MENNSLFGDEAEMDEIVSKSFSNEIGESLSLDVPVKVIGNESFDSYFSVSALAASVFGAVGSSIASLVKDLGLLRGNPNVRVDQRLASLWFHQSIYPIGWDLPPIWDSVAGDYQTCDGWIKLHTNLAHHRLAALKVLGVARNREQVNAAVRCWKAHDLESEIVNEGGVAAAMRSMQEWQGHPQGMAVATEPLIVWDTRRDVKISFSPTSKERPLEGLKVLDLTRVLAGPVATRTLAGFGAEILRIDPPSWEEANVVPDVTLGKRCAHLDLSRTKDKETFEQLLRGADVLVHGYRPGALSNLGYSESVRNSLSPNLIEVSIDAYGWTGPWARRRGFDSLVQMSSGIADAGMHWAGLANPTPLPVQALDHATGYLMAAAVISLIRTALNGQGVGKARLSLARTAELIKAHRQTRKSPLNTLPSSKDFLQKIELTPWGKSHRLRSALSITGVRIEWEHAANNLGSSEASWLPS
jgi:hypothetical protein